MEREHDLNTPPKTSEKPPVKQPCTTPHINGSKPVEISRIDEQCKKHIRRDGKR
jgi:hypothetical protein